MNRLTILARCLSILMIVGLLAAPTMGSASAAGGAVAGSPMSDGPSASMDGMRMAVGGMDCRPADSHPAYDCGHDCPWAMLCTVAFTPADPMVELRSAVAVALSPQKPANDRDRVRRADGPPARPPKT